MVNLSSVVSVTETASQTTFTKDVQIDGDLTVSGTTTTIDSATLTVDDKNIELASTTSPTDTLADGGGITLRGTTDKTILWTDATNSWDFNQAIRNLVDNSGVYLGGGADSRIYYDGTDSFWDLRAVGTGDLMVALAGSFPSPDPGMVHIWSGSAGAVVGASNTTFTIEDNASTGLSILTPNANAGIISFGAPSDAQRGGILYNQSAATPADTFIFTIAGADRLNFSTNTFAFQEAFTISTTAGDLTLAPLDGITVTLGNDPGDDFVIDTSSFVVEGDTGDVGIGLAAPDAPLHVEEVAGAGNEIVVLILDAASSGVNNGPVMSFESLPGGVRTIYGQIAGLDEGSFGGRLEFRTRINTGSGGTDNVSTRMAIIEDGNVGIGTTTPGELLDVRAPPDFPGVVRLATDGTTIVDGNILGRLEFIAPLEASGADAVLVAASIWGEADATFTAILNTTDLVFATANSETATEKMRLTSGGNLGIGITGPTAQLHIDQSSTTAAEPVLFLDQADVSEEMIEFATTIGTGNAIEAVGAKTLTTTHFIKVTLPGGLTRYIPAGTIA